MCVCVACFFCLCVLFLILNFLSPACRSRTGVPVRQILLPNVLHGRGPGHAVRRCHVSTTVQLLHKLAAGHEHCLCVCVCLWTGTPAPVDYCLIFIEGLAGNKSNPGQSDTRSACCDDDGQTSRRTNVDVLCDKWFRLLICCK